MSPALRQAVRQRAGEQCEYCQFFEDDLPLWPFHVDHIIAQQHGGSDALENLAWACQRCNLYKGTNLMAVDSVSSQAVPLFKPRKDAWLDHFSFVGPQIVGVTAIGRATVSLLQMNSEERVTLRLELIALGQWPPHS